MSVTKLPAFSTWHHLHTCPYYERHCLLLFPCKTTLSAPSPPLTGNKQRRKRLEPVDVVLCWFGEGQMLQPSQRITGLEQWRGRMHEMAKIWEVSFDWYEILFHAPSAGGRNVSNFSSRLQPFWVFAIAVLGIFRNGGARDFRTWRHQNVHALLGPFDVRILLGHQCYRVTESSHCHGLGRHQSTRCFRTLFDLIADVELLRNDWTTLGYRVEVCSHQTVDVVLRRVSNPAAAFQYLPHSKELYEMLPTEEE